MAAGTLGYAVGQMLVFGLLAYGVLMLVGRLRGSDTDSTPDPDDVEACPECELELAPMLTECPRCGWDTQDT